MFVSRTRCSALFAAPQSRDPFVQPWASDQQRTAPHCAASGVRNIGSPAPHRWHQHLVAAAGAAVDLLAGAELQVLAQAYPHFREPATVTGHRNRRTAQARIDLDEGLLEIAG